MNVIACLNAVGSNSSIKEDLLPGKTCVDILAKSLLAISDVTAVILFAGPEENEIAEWAAGRIGLCSASLPVTVVRLPDSLAASAFSHVASILKNDELALFCRLDAPFLHAGLSHKLIKNHQKWHAEYTFADGYPLGMSPHILSPRILPELRRLADQKSALLSDNDVIFETIKTDINAFEIETDISPLDLRLLRIDLHCNTRQNTILCRNLASFFEQGTSLAMEDLLSGIKSQQERLRTLPSYFNIQISAGCHQVCSYCPWGQKGPSILNDTRSMPTQQFTSLVERIHAFAPESVVSISLWGEPSRHPEIWKLIELFRTLTPLKLHIETSGLGWNIAELEAFAASANNTFVTWIISLDTMDEATYRSMRGEGFQEALAAAHLFHKLFPKSAYIQAVRSKLNEDGLQKHYQYWKQLGALQIIQKYDHFSLRLPDLRLSDISPLQRNACWHLKRDMNILLDGTVPLCREDYQAKQPMGNVFSDDLAVVWEAMQAPYREHIAGRFSGICAGCDEYYTFNN